MQQQEQAKSHAVLHSRAMVPKPEGTKRTYAQDLLRLDKDTVWVLPGVRRGTLRISG